MKNIKDTFEVIDELEPVDCCRDCIFYNQDIQACVREHDKEPVEKMSWEAACKYYFD